VRVDWDVFYSMKRIAQIILTIPILVLASSLIMATWVKVPWIGVVGLGLLAASSIAAHLTPVASKTEFSKWTLWGAWLGTLLGAIGLLLIKCRGDILDGYYAIIVWLMAASVVALTHRIRDVPLRTRWRVFTVSLALFGSIIWLAVSYSQNLRGDFHFGLLVVLSLLILCKVWFRLRQFAIVTANTLILMLICLPSADVIFRAVDRQDVPLEPGKKYYSYEVAKKNPRAAACWWKGYQTQWLGLVRTLYVPDLGGALPYRLRPNSEALMFQSRISINSKGFRGKDFSAEKGHTYRIVALGESTTFDITMGTDERPWPELLEGMIRERLKPLRPLEVINAGTPSFSLKKNLRRLATDILPVKPDMIISYHGYNGFPMIYTALPRVYGRIPVYRERPIKLLADSEYRLKLVSNKWRERAKLVLQSPARTRLDPLETEFAQDYRELIQFAHTNGIRLVLANYSMAVNEKSDYDVVEYYRAAWPSVYWQIRANQVHSQIVRDLAESHPEVCHVDTQPHLDGEHNKFIDLVHFTDEGRQQLAESIFAGIRKVLEADLVRFDFPAPADGRKEADH